MQILCSKKSRGSQAFTLIEVLVTISVIGILVAILLPALQAIRAASRSTQCVNNLRQLGLAIGSYTAANGVMPAGHQGLGYSLHVQILPYIEQTPLYNAINFQVVSGHSPLNDTCTSTNVATFLCPTDVGNYGGTGVTNYAGNRGYRFDERGPSDNGGVSVTSASAFPPDRISDGSSNTAAMSEWLITRGGFGLRDPVRSVFITSPHMAGPKVYDKFLAECGGLNLSSAPIGNAKGVRWMTGILGGSLYTHDYVINGRSCSNGGLVQISAYTAGSLHNRMAHVLFLDGHVTPVRDSITLSVWQAIGTRAGGEVITNIPE